MGIVITTRNDEALIGNCMASLLNADYPKNKLDIVVVDRGSSDHTPDVVHTRAVRLVRTDERSVTRARNRGIKSTTTPIIVFTDPDCVVSTQWLRELVSPFEQGNVGAVAGDILPYPGGRSAEKFAARARSHSPVVSMRHPFCPYAMTPNAAFRAEVFERVGLFDTRFPGGGWEDADLCWRMRDGSSFSLAFAEKAIVFHRYRNTSRSYFAQHLRYGRGCALIQQKYRKRIPGAAKRNLSDFHVLARVMRLFVVAAMAPCGRASRQQLRDSYFSWLREAGQWAGFGLGLIQAHTDNA